MTDPDHDLLLIISNDTKWIKEWAINHEKEDSANNALVKQAAQAAHIRMDSLIRQFNWLIISGFLALVTVAITLWFK